MDTNTPFDIGCFRYNIGYDREIEKTLLSLFIDSTETALAELKNTLCAKEHTRTNPEVWFHYVHLMKGAALNLRADNLGAILDKMEWLSTYEERLQALSDIEVEYGKIKRFIEGLS